MQEASYDGAAERKVLISCITRSDFLARILTKVGDKPFRAQHTNMIYGWCARHIREHGHAPNREIQTYWAEWAATCADKDSLKLVERFLGGLSVEPEEKSEMSFLLALAERTFNDILVERLEETLKANRERGKSLSSLEDLRNFPTINLKGSPCVDVLTDANAQRSALEHKQEVLIKYPGAAGEFFGDELAQDSFVAFMAPPKVGKSWWLMDVAWQAMKQGRNVGYFQVGDMTQGQVMRRFLMKAANRPIKARTIRYPTGIVPPGDSKAIATIDHKEIPFQMEMDWELAKERLRAIRDKRKGNIWLSCHPVKTVSVLDIKTVLDEWDREGRVCDAVIIDYAGNLAPVDARSNPVEQVANTWAMMRQLSEVRKCLVVTAQQTNKEGFRSWVLTRSNFADSKMILAHVTAFAGVNQTDEEKKLGMFRLNWLVRREEDFSETYCLWIGHCLAVANPIVVAALPSGG